MLSVESQQIFKTLSKHSKYAVCDLCEVFLFEKFLTNFLHFAVIYFSGLQKYFSTIF